MPVESGRARRRDWLLGIGLGLLGLITWWQVRQLPPDAEPRTLRSREPDYRVLGLVALETDPQGQPTRRLAATELRYFADEDLAELTAPQLVLYRPDGPPWQARARAALIRNNGDALELSGAVQLERARGTHNRPVRLETERLDIWPQQGLAETDRSVRIESDGETLVANGMRLWYLEDAIRGQFTGRVRMHLNPATNPHQP